MELTEGKQQLKEYNDELYHRLSKIFFSIFNVFVKKIVFLLSTFFSFFSTFLCTKTVTSQILENLVSYIPR